MRTQTVRATLLLLVAFCVLVVGCSERDSRDAAVDAEAGSAASGDALPVDEFKKILDKRDVPIDKSTRIAVREFADNLDPVPPEVATMVEQLSDQPNTTSFRILIPVLAHESSQAVCSTMTRHRDPLVRFISNSALAGSGDSQAAKTVHTLIHDESISLLDQRLIRTWCDGVGIRESTDDAAKILAHLSAAMSSEPKFRKGDVAPDIDATTVSRRRIVSGELKGKLIVLHFWSTWCGPCISQMPSHISALSKYDAGEVEISFVHLDHNKELFRSTVQEYRIPFNNVRESGGWGGELVRVFGVNSLPFDVVIGRGGKVFSNSISDIGAALSDDLIR